MQAFHRLLTETKGTTRRFLAKTSEAELLWGLQAQAQAWGLWGLQAQTWGLWAVEIPPPHLHSAVQACEGVRARARNGSKMWRGHGSTGW